MKRSIKDSLPRNAVNLGRLENFDSRRLSATRPYSQEGEDMILSYIFTQKDTTGFYVDVGAHHPKRFSNTYFFYEKG